MTDRERLTTNKRKIFARESLTILSMNKEELRKHYNEIFDRLQEYEVAEEQGQLIRLPCKVGDALYLVRQDIQKVVEVIVTAIIQRRTFPYAEVYVVEYNRKTLITLAYWGERLFATTEEAEKALKGGAECL